jgi:methionine aminotransferase
MKMESKLPGAGTTIFTVMSALARECNAINLSQGFPDFDCSPRLAELASHYIKTGHNQYAPMAGTIQLRERIAQIIQQSYGTEYHPDTCITVTAGATQGIYTAVAAIVRPGDEVIVLEPAYDCYVPAIILNGGIPVYSKLREADFSINWEEIRSKLSKRTRAILINSPHNPSGAVLSGNDIAELEKIVAADDVIVISDEVYEHIIFDGRIHHSIARSKKLAERSFLISSFGKTVHTTGWKIGYAAASNELMAEFRKVHQFLVFVVNHPLQLALADFLADAEVYTGLRNFYQAKRDLFLKLTRTSRLKPVGCSGTYFQLMSYAGLYDEKDAGLAKRLTREKGIASIPMSAFYHDGMDNKLLRFCFAKKDETLERAAEILCRL